MERIPRSWTGENLKENLRTVVPSSVAKSSLFKEKPNLQGLSLRADGERGYPESPRES